MGSRKYKGRRRTLRNFALFDGGTEGDVEAEDGVKEESELGGWNHFEVWMK